MSAAGGATIRFRAGSCAATLALLLVLAPGLPAAAQQGGGTIETEKLAPLAPPTPDPDAADPDVDGPDAGGVSGDGVVPRDDRFKTAPFRGAPLTVVPTPIDPVATVPSAGARLRQLDKMTGRIKTVEVAAGGEAMIDRLKVRVETCRAPADNSQHGTMAFLEIWDTKYPDADAAFSGWMFAESPALSALDHPRYDVWVLGCTSPTTSSAEASSASR